MYIYLNGQLVKQEEAKISALDHGYMYGLGVFETFPVYDGHPFLLDDHFQRLQDSLKELSISWIYDKNNVLEIIKKLLYVNHLKDAYIRWNISAGVGSLGLETDVYEEPTVIVYIKPLPKSGVTEKKAKILKTIRNTPEGERRLKSHHFLNNIIGKRELGNALNTEGIFLNAQGFVAEGVVSNLFWVKGGTVFTPSIGTGILNGVTRDFLLSLLDEKGISYQIGEYSASDLLSAEEAFVTNSIQEIVPLVEVDDYPLPGRAGTVTKQLQHLYDQYKTKLWSRSER